MHFFKVDLCLFWCTSNDTQYDPYSQWCRCYVTVRNLLNRFERCFRKGSKGNKANAVSVLLHWIEMNLMHLMHFVIIWSLYTYVSNQLHQLNVPLWCLFCSMKSNACSGNYTRCSKMLKIHVQIVLSTEISISKVLWLKGREKFHWHNFISKKFLSNTTGYCLIDSLPTSFLVYLTRVAL